MNLPPRSPSRFAARASLGCALLIIGVFFLAAYQRRWMHDDGFINLRIVRNVLDGYGPVFNIDERVEATTSPLWVLLLVGAGAAGLRLEDAAVYGGLVLATSGLVCAMFAARLRLDASEDAEARAGEWRAPLGAVAFVALPPAWDFATSGLEMGLVFSWLGASFLTVVAMSRRREATRSGAMAWFFAAALLGLGWLIRPELALYAAALFVALARAFDAALPARRKGTGPRTLRIALLLLAALALPGAYQLFRMGYYGALTANPAMAKEAFRANWRQGWCYFRNFFGVYGWAVPGAVLALFYLRAWWRKGGELVGLAATARLRDAVAPWFVGAAAAHALYIVAIGGDYMHGRMFLPAVFAATMPLFLVDVRAPGIGRRELVWRGLGAAMVAGWAVICATVLRPRSENQCAIGDERAWYVQLAKTDHPIRVEDFLHHPFHVFGLHFLRAIDAHCPTVLTLPKNALVPCRRVIELEVTELDRVAVNSTSNLVTQPEATTVGVVAMGAIGIVGVMLPSTVHLVDRHGLADAVGARFSVNERGRPGHEKRLTDAWVLGRFTSYDFPEDASVTAARNALGCGRLATVFNRSRAPMTPRLFFENIARAGWMQRLRVPPDPFAAEELFCDVPGPVSLSAGGDGGVSFAWRCPVGTQLSGLRVSIHDKEKAIGQWVPLCSSFGSSLAQGKAHDPFIAGPPLGDATEHRLELHCPAGSLPTGIFGRANHLVRQIGLSCADLQRGVDGANTRTLPAGVEEGAPFELLCPARTAPIGVIGRSGYLLDAVGISCGPPPP